MADLKSFPVYSDSGQIGRVLASARFLDDRAQKTILLSNGKEVNVPADALDVRRDGSFFLRNASRFLNGNANPPASNPASDEDTRNGSETVPPKKESVAVVPSSSSTPVPAGAAVNATPARPQIPAEILFQSGYDIETVPVNKVVEGPVEERHEGDTLVLPVVEEVWVVEKKLYLRQEIRITKKKIQVNQAQTIEKLPSGERPV